MSNWSGKVYLAPSGEWAFKFFRDGEEMGGGAGFNSKDDAIDGCVEVLSSYDDNPRIEIETAEVPGGDPIEKWRILAGQFHCVQDCLASGSLSASYEPGDLAELQKDPEFSPGIRAVFSFLLHVWNSANPFDLRETQRWDKEHLRAFRDWVEGRTFGGSPMLYF